MKLRTDVATTYLKPRKRWSVRWYGKFCLQANHQPRFCRTFKRKRDADTFAQSLKIDIKDGICTEPKTISLKNLCDKFISSKKGNKEPATVRAYIQTTTRLLNYFGSHRNIKTITDQEAQEFTNQIELVKTDKSPTEKTPADSTRVKHLKNSKVLFNQAQNWNYIRNNCFKNITITNISKEDWHFLNFNEFNALLKALNKLPIRENKKQLDQERILRLRAFYGVMYGCGLRFGEAIHLWWDKNIDFLNSQIHIKNRKSKNGYPGFNLKNHQDRTLPCPRWVMGLLEELKKVSHKNNPYVLLSEERLGIIKDKFKEWSSEDKLDKWANDVMVNNTNRDFVVNCRRAGIVSSDRLSVHCLRKSYGTLLADLNTPVHTLKQLMGHSSIETTLKFYIKNSDENSWKAVRGLEGVVQS